MKQLFTPFLGLLMMLTAQAQAAEFETAKSAVKNMGWAGILETHSIRMMPARPGQLPNSMKHGGDNPLPNPNS